MAAKKKPKTAKKGKDLLFEEHLQWVCELELWTIPLYLTAAYSIKPLHEQTNSGLAATVQKELLSVAVQEMYHTQLACNLAATFGVAPRLANPSYKKLPHIKAQPSIPVRLGNVYEVVDLMIEVETPDSHCPPEVPPKPNKKGEILYNSIGDIYHVVTKMVINNWDNPYYAKKREAYLLKQKTESTFSGRYPQAGLISDLSSALTTIRVIVEQGEGAQEGGCAPIDPREPLPDYDQPTATSRFHAYDDHSHWDRFMDIKSKIYNHDGHKLVAVYDKVGRAKKGAAAVQKGLDAAYSFFLFGMRKAWSVVQDKSKTQPVGKQYLNTTFFDPMYFLRELITQVWQQNAVPAYNEMSSPKAALAAYQKAVKDFDTLDLYHWNSKDKKLADKYQHACQGLNTCKGRGHNGSGTVKGGGDGSCATASPHFCSNSNSCQGQGGCAYQNNPNINTKAGNGGCQAPISPNQVFGQGVTAIQNLSIEVDGVVKKYKKGDSVTGVPVWNYARALFAAKNKIKSLPKINETSERRNSVFPTSPKYN